MFNKSPREREPKKPPTSKTRSSTGQTSTVKTFVTAFKRQSQYVLVYTNGNGPNELTITFYNAAKARNFLNGNQEKATNGFSYSLSQFAGATTDAIRAKEQWNLPTN